MEPTLDQMLQQGIAAHNQGNLQEAERLYRAILEAQPKHPDANHNLGLIAIAMSQPKVGLSRFKAAVDANPNIEQFWLSYIEALIIQRQFEDAKQALEQGKEKGVAKETLKTLKQKLESVKVGNVAVPVPLQGPSQDVLQKLIDHYQNGRYGDAEELALAIIKQFPEYPFSYNVLGGVYQQTGRLSELINVSEKVTALSPEDAEAHSNLGLALRKVGRLEESELSYKRALKLKPDFAEVYRDLANVLDELGRSAEAETGLMQAIALKPDYAEAHSNLGVVLQKAGRLKDAEACCRQAIALNPEYAEAHSNLGVTLQELGSFDEAVASCKQAIALNSDFAEAHFNMGVTLKELERLADAEASFRRAIVIKPGYAEAHSNLGSTLEQLGRLEEAEASVRQAIALEPDLAEAHNNLSATLQQLGRFDEAEASVRQAIALSPENGKAHNKLGTILHAHGKLGEAEASLSQAIVLEPDYAEAHSNLGATLQEMGRLEEAEESYRQAIALKPDFVYAHLNLCMTLKKLGRLEEAEASCEQALVLKPDDAEVKIQKAVLLLNRQEFQLGWSLYSSSRDRKLEFREFEVTPGSFAERAERWKGTSLRGKSIQVHAAQGVGDEILFSSCIPDLIHEFPSKIYLECDPRLEPLFARSFPEVMTYGRARALSLSQAFNEADISVEDVHFDYSIPIDGLPQFFRNKIEDFPSRDGFLVPDPEGVDKWKKRLDDLGEGLKIGISWFGGSARLSKKRSIPLADWGNLLSADAFFVNLQYGDTSEEVAQFSAENNIKIYDWEDNNALLDLDNQAALISTLDLVITVDNATVQSCISLGKEVWDLIDPSLNLLWMENGTGVSPLSQNLRFFKKENQDNWGAVLSCAEEQLRARIKRA